MAEKTTITPDLEGKKLTMERVFDAPRELVFKAWTEPERLMQWFGPREWPLVHCTVDLRPGGVWHYCMQGPDGTQSWGKGVYSEIDPPSRLVYTDVFSDEQGNTAENMPAMNVAIDFIDEAGKTRIVSRADFASAEALQALLDMGMLEGASETWDILAEYLAKATA